MSDLKNSKPKNQQIKMHTYRVTADIHTLKISKQSTFQSKILWKRRTSPDTQTTSRQKPS